MRILNLAVAGLLLVALAGGGVALALASYRPKPDARVSFSDAVPYQGAVERQTDQSRLRIAVAAVLSPRATLESYETLAAYLSAQLGQPVDLIQSRSYAETNALVRSGDVALALVCSGAYVAGRRDFGMEALVIPVVSGETTYRSYLIVPSESSAESWADLRGKRFAFTDPLSNTGRLVPVYMLSRMGETPERFFEDFIFTYSHDKSIQAVAEGLVDAASVDSLVYDFMAHQDSPLVRRTKAIWASPPYGINPVVVRPGGDPALRSKLRDIFLRMNEDPEGRQVLSRLGIDSFTLPDPRAYDVIEEMLSVTAAR